MELQKAFSVFLEKFPPKENFTESEIQMTTDEVVRTFLEFGITAERDDIIRELETNNYQFEPFDDDGKIAFKWLL